MASTAAVLLRAQAAPPTPARTVWNGVYTADQAQRGSQQFGTHCASCHAADLTGGEGPSLVGESFMNSWRESTVDALLEFLTSKEIDYSVFR